jgi:hypothetical protein
MKRGLIISFICIVLLLIYFSLSAAQANDITGKYIDGKATSPVNASIQVISIGPTINIISPKEGRTYRNLSILLNYSVYDPDGIFLVWYNIDQGDNISLGSTSGYTYFNTSEGSHTLYLYANDTTSAISSASVNFQVNNTKIIVIYEEFRGSKRGSSIDFDSLSDEQLENLPDMVLENINYGKILWNKNINITDDINPGDRITNLDRGVEVGRNFIFVNSTYLPNLNNKSTLWFYNLSFKNPKVMKDGKACPSSVCTGQQYLGGTLRVNVTGFSNYSVQETSGGRGGGGGGGTISSTNVSESEILFFFYPDLIKASLIKGEKKTEHIKIKNFENSSVEFQLSLDLDMLNLSEENFILGPQEEKDIILIIKVPQDIEPEIYTGNVIITAKEGNRTKTEKINVVVAVSEEKKLFDLKVNVPPEYKSVKAGDSVLAEIEIYNLGITQEEVDVELRYSLRDLDNNIIQEGSKTIAVHTTASDVLRLDVPKNTKKGRYIFAVDVVYDSQKAFSIDDFNVENKEPINFTYILITTVVALAIILVLIEYRKYRHMEKVARRATLLQMNYLPQKTKYLYLKNAKKHAQKA